MPRKYHWKNQETRELFQAILALKNADEAERFFRDLCTISEISEMAERWEVAKLLKIKTPYRIISKKTGSSTATITRIAYWLHHGMGGYERALERMK